MMKDMAATDRHSDAPGKAEIARQHIANPIEVLFVNRPIKPELRADLRQHLRVAPLLSG
jgi:hypothetical protein